MPTGKDPDPIDPIDTYTISGPDFSGWIEFDEDSYAVRVSSRLVLGDFLDLDFAFIQSEITAGGCSIELSA